MNILLYAAGARDQTSSLFRVMKAFRMVRLLKLAREYDGSVVIYHSLKVPHCAVGMVMGVFEKNDRMHLLHARSDLGAVAQSADVLLADCASGLCVVSVRCARR